MAACLTAPSRARAGAGSLVRCLVCGAPAPDLVLDLGSMPLANNLIDPADERSAPAYPLRLGACSGCGHVQLLDRVAPWQMFADYLYVSSASDALTRHLEGTAETCVRRLGLGAADLAVDIGSNDGTLGAAIRRRGPRVVGVDPARNLAPLAEGKGVAVEVSCFDPRAAERVRRKHGRAALITATNSFPHIQDLDAYFEAVDRLLSPAGALAIEAHYLLDFLDQGAFDTIYHEHVSYWSLSPLVRLLDRHGFAVEDVERLPVHHGQLRLWIRRREAARPTPRVDELLALEQREIRSETLATFALKARKQIEELRTFVLDRRAQSKSVAAYGAPAKGSTLLCAAGLDASLVDFAVDRNPLKQGLLMPGSRVPVAAPERLLAVRPDYTLLLAWNFEEEIVASMRGYLERGGCFVAPVPAIRIIKP